MKAEDADGTLFNSLHSLKKAEASPYLYAQVRQRLASRQETEVRLSSGWALRLAMVVLALLVADLWTLQSDRSQPVKEQTTAYTYPVENYYF